MRRVILATWFALLGSTATASAARLEGNVVDASTGKPLPSAEVTVLASADSSVVAHRMTDSDGGFAIDGLVPGKYRVRVRLLGHVGFDRSELVLDAAPGLLSLGRIALAVAPIELPGVETHTERSPARLEADRNVYLSRDLPGATTGSAADMLRAVPELEVDIDGHVSLRGKSGVNVQFNGRPAPMKGEDLATYLRQTRADRIDRVEVIPNPSARYDPEGTAGIVNLVLKDDVSLGPSGSLSASAGQRFAGPGARVAWQCGPMTVFGGVSGSLSHWLYDSESERTSLVPGSGGGLDSDTGNESRSHYGVMDLSFDYLLRKRLTFYGTLNASGGSGDPDANSHDVSRDASGSVTDTRDRFRAGHWANHGAAGTLGLQHVVEKGRDERSLELLLNHWPGDWTSRTSETLVGAAGTGSRTIEQASQWAYRERSVQADDTRPLGAHAKLESGGRIARRSQDRFDGLLDTPEASGTPQSSFKSNTFVEDFRSIYALMSRTLGRWSAQAGARYEFAHTTFDARPSGSAASHDYRSLFPSGNLAVDLGKGRAVRASYARHLDRPQPYQIDPDVIVSDSLNVYEGNPELDPMYTHSIDLDMTWAGSRGSVKLSPYWRRTVDNWDQVARVDTIGRSVSTWENASSVRNMGVTFTGSYRRTGRIGGTASIGWFQDHHDASNLSSENRHDVTGWSANGNASFKLTKDLDLQVYLRYAPPRALAQGRASSYVGSYLACRYAVSPRLSLAANVNDPFGLSKFSSDTGDATYRQHTEQDNHMRSLNASLTWTWGKPPETKERKQSSSAPRQGGGENP